VLANSQDCDKRHLFSAIADVARRATREER
jgi:hypothetical protein